MATDPTYDFLDQARSPFRFNEAVSSDPEVPLLADTDGYGWPYKPEAGEDYVQRGCYWESLSIVLGRPWKTDVHFTQYNFAPAILCMPRLVAEALDGTGGKPILGDGIRVGLFLVDRDCPESHRSGGGNGKSAPEKWREAERQKVALLQQKIPGVFFYETRKGYRLVFRLPYPFLLRSKSDAALWRLLYIRLLCYLAREFDIVGDPTTKVWNNLFRAPHATRDDGPEPEDLLCVGDPRAIGVLPYIPTADTLELDIKTATKLAPLEAHWGSHALTELTAKPGHSSSGRRGGKKSPPTPVAFDATALSSFGKALADVLKNVDDERHQLYLSLSGALLYRGLDAATLPDLIERVAMAAGDEKAAARRHDAMTTVEKFTQGQEMTGMTSLRREWPQVAAVVDEYLPQDEQDGVEALRVELLARPVPKAVALTDVPAIISSEINSADKELVVVCVTPGAGKTTAAASFLVSTTRKASMVMGMNALATEHYATVLAARSDVQRRFGVSSVKDANGEPGCKSIKRVLAVQAAGLSPIAHVCESCEYKSSCSIRGGIEGAEDALIQLTNHAMMSTAQRFVGASGLLLVDESPGVFHHEVFNPASVKGLKKALSAGVYETGFILACRPAVRLVEQVFEVRGQHPTLSFEACKVEAAARLKGDRSWPFSVSNAFGLGPWVEKSDDPVVVAALALEHALSKKDTPPLERDALKQIRAGNADKAELIETSWKLMHALLLALQGGTKVRAEWDVPPPWAPASISLRVSRVEPTVSSSLSRSGPTVLMDATADEQALASITQGKSLRTVHIDVVDGAPTERVMRFWSKGSRTATIERGKPKSEVIAPVLKDAFNRARASKVSTVLVVSYKSAIDLLRDVRDGNKQDAVLEGALRGAPTKIVFAHYGALRGMNEFEGVGWADVDGVITLGDPWPDVPAAAAEAVLLGLTEDAAGMRVRNLAAAVSSITPKRGDLTNSLSRDRSASSST